MGPAGPGRARIVPASEADRPAIRRILRRTGLFREEEVAVALEVLDVYLYQEGQRDYQVYVAAVEGRTCGYVCFGLNALTAGTFELYWIAVEPGRQGGGIGTALMDAAEETASLQGGRLIAVETSSRPDYAPTRAFYGRRGYREEARVPDYYAPGDDKVILTRKL